MDSSRATKRLWRIARVVFYMIRKGISKDKLMLDLHLLLKRGKVAGKALGNLMTFHHHHHRHHHTSGTATYSGFSCRSMDPDLSFYHPAEVEFSCSNTPAFRATKQKHRRGGRRCDLYDYDAVAVAEAFEILNYEASDAESVAASPSPAMWSFGKSPAGVRKLRVTDSPFPWREEEEEVDSCVDEQAEEFIKRFYEKLRLQQMVPMTPEYKRYRQEAVMGRA
ncbi:hypothetical protein Cni_G21155 [Canna indica]|uniref:Avr9/Cf-9 rapidly elicited protein 146 n=1 Tax=Canna indica TaxID=4628 RepID=A0AAQ3QIE6_9LILI|nr:hypothetical protein Cni_G21155 [Canna indica]